MDRKKSTRSKRQHQKSSKARVVPGDVRLMVHSQVNLNLDTVNLRKLDIAILPSNFDMFLRFAALYQHYRVLKGSWRFYALRHVNAIQTPSVPVYPLLVY